MPLNIVTVAASSPPLRVSEPDGASIGDALNDPELLALLDRQCFPMCIGRIELDEIVRHGFLQRRLIEISQRSLTNAARGIGRAHLQPLGAKRTNPIRLVFTSIVEPVTDRVLHVIGRVSTQG